MTAAALPAELEAFGRAVGAEALQQREHWAGEGAAGKSAGDWLFLVGHMASQACTAAAAGDAVAFEIHTTAAAAVLANWRAHVLGHGTDMRPGIDPFEAGIEPEHPDVAVVLRFLARPEGRRVDHIAMPSLLELAGIARPRHTAALQHCTHLALRRAGWVAYLQPGLNGPRGHQRRLYKAPAGSRQP